MSFLFRLINVKGAEDDEQFGCQGEENLENFRWWHFYVEAIIIVFRMLTHVFCQILSHQNLKLEEIREKTEYINSQNQASI